MWTSDIVMKRLAYLYLTNYAQSRQDLVLLCISTLYKVPEKKSDKEFKVILVYIKNYIFRIYIRIRNRALSLDSRTSGKIDD